MDGAITITTTVDLASFVLELPGLMFLPAKINKDQPAVKIGSNWYKLVLPG